MIKKFQRKIEDFICENCGLAVKGSGYTNHCPQCFYSKHVDINPGDRSNSCQGMMQPVNVELKHGEYKIIHHCIKCGFKKKNKIQDIDNMDNLIELMEKIAKK